MERQEILEAVEKFHSLEQELNAIPEGAGWIQRFGIIDEQCNLIKEILEDFPILFDHYSLKYTLHRILEHNSEITIDRVSDRGHDPKVIFLLLDKLKELDAKLMANEMHYVYHIETGHFADGGVCVQAYYCSSELYKEWDQLYDTICEEECNQSRWIAPELRALAPFLEKHQRNEELVEIWSAEY